MLFLHSLITWHDKKNKSFLPYLLIRGGARAEENNFLRPDEKHQNLNGVLSANISGEPLTYSLNEERTHAINSSKNTSVS